MFLQNLIYVSKSVGLQQPDLDAILLASQKNNLANKLTGMLLYNSDYFMQVLEGERAAVTHTFHRILNDPRHADVEIVHAGQIDSRQFAKWAMHYVPSGRRDRALLLKYSLNDFFDPTEMTQTALIALAKEIAWSMEEDAFDSRAA